MTEVEKGINQELALYEKARQAVFTALKKSNNRVIIRCRGIDQDAVAESLVDFKHSKVKDLLSGVSPFSIFTLKTVKGWVISGYSDEYIKQRAPNAEVSGELQDTVESKLQGIIRGEMNNGFSNRSDMALVILSSTFPDNAASDAQLPWHNGPFYNGVINCVWTLSAENRSVKLIKNELDRVGDHVLDFGDGDKWIVDKTDWVERESFEY